MIILCYLVIMQHSVNERILKIGPLVFEFIQYKEKYKSLLFIILVQITYLDQRVDSFHFIRRRMAKWHKGC